MQGIPFVKMHGLGNDFVVLDARARLPAPDAAGLGDRRTGIGFDQLILIERPANGALAALRFLNADGSPSAACGNGTRCAAALLMDEAGLRRIELETEAGTVEAWRQPDGRVSVRHPPPRLDWTQIPLAHACDTLDVPVSRPGLGHPAACSVGNPHATFFVADVAAIDPSLLGPGLEHDPIFPERANIGFAQILAGNRIRLRVWERGAGLTRACGTGSLATLVNAHRRGLTARRATIELDGGEVEVEWTDSSLILTGPVALSFRGTLP